MKTLLYGVLFSTIPLCAQANPYLDLGLGMEIGGCVYHKWTPQPVEIHCSQSPLGHIAVGYEHKDFSVSLEHWSSLMHEDRGLNLFSVKYRWGGRD